MIFKLLVLGELSHIYYFRNKCGRPCKSNRTVKTICEIITIVNTTMAFTISLWKTIKGKTRYSKSWTARRVVLTKLTYSLFHLNWFPLLNFLLVFTKAKSIWFVVARNFNIGCGWTECIIVMRFSTLKLSFMVEIYVCTNQIMK